MPGRLLLGPWPPRPKLRAVAIDPTALAGKLQVLVLRQPDTAHKVEQLIDRLLTEFDNEG